MSLTINNYLSKINSKNNKEGIFILDSDGFFLQANADMENIIGYIPFDLIGTSLAQLMPIQEIIRTRELFKDVMNGNIVQFETVLIHKNGHKVYVCVEFTPHMFNGKTMGVLTTVRAIANENDIPNEHSKTIIQILDNKGEIKYVSSTLEKILGYSIQQIIGNSFLDFIHQDDQYKAKNIIQELKTIRKKMRVELKHIHQNGYSIILSSEFASVFSSSGDIERIIISYDMKGYTLSV